MNDTCNKCFNIDADPWDYYNGNIEMPKCEGKCYFDNKQKGDDGWWLSSRQIEDLTKYLHEEQKEYLDDHWLVTCKEYESYLNDIEKNKRILENLSLHRYD